MLNQLRWRTLMKNRRQRSALEEQVTNTHHKSARMHFGECKSLKLFKCQAVGTPAGWELLQWKPLQPKQGKKGKKHILNTSCSTCAVACKHQLQLRYLPNGRSESVWGHKAGRRNKDGAVTAEKWWKRIKALGCGAKGGMEERCMWCNGDAIATSSI